MLNISPMKVGHKYDKGSITMARMELDGRSWEEARAEAEQAGIVLTKRKHKKGGCVCYANKELRKLFQN